MIAATVTTLPADVCSSGTRTPRTGHSAAACDHAHRMERDEDGIDADEGDPEMKLAQAPSACLRRPFLVSEMFAA